MTHLINILATFFFTVALNLHNGLAWDTGLTWIDKLTIGLVITSLLSIGALFGVAYCSLQTPRLKRR